MKIGGRKPESPSIEIVVLPREPERVQAKNQDGSLAFDIDGKTPIWEEQNRDIVFKAKAVLDYSEFNQYYPEPKPPLRRRVGETDAQPNFSDRGYQDEIKKYQTAQTHWLLLKSLEATDNLEWEKVKVDDPNTWALWIDELKEAGLTNPEVNRVMEAVMAANSLNQERYTEAKNRFLASQVNGKASVH